jgi:hypothetical protein
MPVGVASHYDDADLWHTIEAVTPNCQSKPGGKRIVEKHFEKVAPCASSFARLGHLCELCELCAKPACRRRTLHLWPRRQDRNVTQRGRPLTASDSTKIVISGLDKGRNKISIPLQKFHAG